MPTIDRGDGGDLPDHALHLIDEVELTSSEGLTALTCQLHLGNIAVYESLRHVKNPWIRKGSDCRRALAAFEFILRVRGLG